MQRGYCLDDCSYLSGDADAAACVESWLTATDRWGTTLCSDPVEDDWCDTLINQPPCAEMISMDDVCGL